MIKYLASIIHAQTRDNQICTLETPQRLENARIRNLTEV